MGVSVQQKRYAMVSAIAATGVPALVMAKGHRIEETPEVPLVVSNNVQSFAKTKEAMIFLRRNKAHNDVDQGLVKAFRNIPGVDTIQVGKLNLLKLAPGGHVGRFCIWTEAAFKKLDSIYGTWRVASKEKVRWNLPQPKMAVTDLTKLLKAEEIRQVLRKPNKGVKLSVVRTNPLKNIRTMLQLNPHAAVTKRAAEMANKKVPVKKAAPAKKAAAKKPAKK